MNLDLNHEQRRCALWKSFSLPGMRGMVQSYGFNTSSMNIGLLIATNVQRFMQYSRETTNNRWSRPTDAQRIAANVLTAAAISTPLRVVATPDANVRQRTTGNVTVRKTLEFLAIPLGSHHLLKKCRKYRIAAKDWLNTAFDFLGPKRHWAKVPDEIWGKFRHDWLPNCPYVSNVPAMHETIILKDASSKYIMY
jgi:hypothetical protein